MKKFEYTAVIRTLGLAGQKYQTLLDSLCSQTVQPKDIIVYLADGYDAPAQTCGREQIVRVPKGMAAQRALPYTEVETEWILYLDDDAYLPPATVENMYAALQQNHADVVAIDAFDHTKTPLLPEIMMTLAGRMRARRHSRQAYKVMRTTGFSYNKHPRGEVLQSETNAGVFFLIRKSNFLKIRFEEELWLDANTYAIGDDQVMFYKMHLMGLRQLTLFGSGAEHLDAGGNLTSSKKERELIESDFYFRRVFWQRFIQEPEKNACLRVWNRLCWGWFCGFGLAVSAIKGKRDILKAKLSGLRRARAFLASDAYRALPKIEKKL